MASVSNMKFDNNIPKFKRLLEQEKKDILKRIGLFIEGEAKLRTPVDTGLLRGSISHKVVSDKEVQVGTDIEYSDYVEFGTSKKQAQPFLTPAFEENSQEIKNIIIDGIRRVTNS